MVTSRDERSRRRYVGMLVEWLRPRKKKRCNKLAYGTARVTVSKTRVLRSIYGSIQEHAGFEGPSWLD